MRKKQQNINASLDKALITIRLICLLEKEKLDVIRIPRSVISLTKGMVEPLITKVGRLVGGRSNPKWEHLLGDNLSCQVLDQSDILIKLD